ncbi:MAG: DUF1292 domain-containing protein [Ruminococcaceae bacterium]|nr:DUF1292 domain-containing protein [Oscillospiraceae bacterium]
MNKNQENKILTFTDEDGNEVRYEIADSFEYNNQVYVALLPPEEEEFDADVLIMRIETEDSGEDVLVYIQDDEELDGAFEMFKERVSDEYDFLD